MLTDEQVKQFYDSALWKHTSDTIKKERLWCELCKSTKQLEVHHIFPLRKYSNIETSLNPDHLLLLCHVCHLKEENNLAPKRHTIIINNEQVESQIRIAKNDGDIVFNIPAIEATMQEQLTADTKALVNNFLNQLIAAITSKQIQRRVIIVVHSKEQADRIQQRITCNVISK